MMLDRNEYQKKVRPKQTMNFAGIPIQKHLKNGFTLIYRFILSPCKENNRYE